MVTPYVVRVHQLADYCCTVGRSTATPTRGYATLTLLKYAKRESEPHGSDSLFQFLEIATNYSTPKISGYIRLMYPITFVSSSGVIFA